MPRRSEAASSGRPAPAESDTGRRWIIVSNRLPFSYDPRTRTLARSSGGLVTAIRGIHRTGSLTWVGAAPQGLVRKSFEEALASSEAGADIDYRPVFVAAEEYDAYYNGMGNDVLWPLLHYETEYVRFDPRAWEAYQRVNARFARAVLQAAGPDDLVWVHDYHLFLLPALLKKKQPSLRVGFFLHVPFPSSEIFRQLAVRKELLEAVLQADLVGFHDYDYLRHFANSVATLLGRETTLSEVRSEGEGGHTTQLGVFPVAIDTAAFAAGAASPAVSARIRAIRRQRNYELLVLGVDRLDYTKGIELKLKAFREMLRRHPEMRERVRLLQVAVPSRTDVPEYARLKEEIDRLVGEINGEYGAAELVPVHYLFTSVPFEELLAYYRLADALLVTSKRDGMNLVALEYIAAQRPQDPGVVVLSEFTGSSSILSHAMPVNPWDLGGTAERIYEALTLSRAQRVERHRPMLRYLERYTATGWAGSFMQALEAGPRTPPQPTGLSARALVSEIGARLQRKPLVVLCDYDGTLVPIRARPEQALMDEDTRRALRKAARTAWVQLVVVSGRSQRFLQHQLHGMAVSFAAEHGAIFVDTHNSRRYRLVTSDTAAWYELALQLMGDFARRTPGSQVERKRFCVAWHYRNAPKVFGEHQGLKLREKLEAGLANAPATVISGDKVIEVRAVEGNKGTFARWFGDYLEALGADAQFLAIGDDRTDEDLFAALGDEGLSVKVGPGLTRARHRLRDQSQVLPFVEGIARRVRELRRSG